MPKKRRKPDPMVARNYVRNQWFNEAQQRQRDARARRLAERIAENDKAAAAVALCRLERDRRAERLAAEKQAIADRARDALRRMEERDRARQRGGRPRKHQRRNAA